MLSLFTIHASTSAHTRQRTKNTRLLSEFREIDSYLTDSESDDDTEEPREKLAQTEFDNSILRSATALCRSASANPVSLVDKVTGEHSKVTPRVTIRFTRLDPTCDDESLNDPRISQTIECVKRMGIKVLLGNNPTEDIEIPSSVPLRCSDILVSQHVNLDLSILIALVSDLTHSGLPSSVDEARARFQIESPDRHWKPEKSVREAKDDSPNSERMDDEEDEDLAKHTRALINQQLQEMGRSMLQEIRDHLLVASPERSLETVEFWTTPEARDRCM